MVEQVQYVEKAGEMPVPVAIGKVKKDKTVSVAYCGGCAPCYTRSNLVEALIERLRNMDEAPVLVEANETADLRVVILSCPMLCAQERLTNINPAKTTLVIGWDERRPNPDIVEYVIRVLNGVFTK